MSELTPEIVDTVVAACQAGAEEAAGALSRTLDAEMTMTVGEPASYDSSAPPEGFDGPGLAILMTFGEVGAVALLPQSTGLLPDWVAEPDATGESKLSTLAQELSMLLIPETLFADDFQASWVDDLAGALQRGGAAADAGLVPLQLAAGESQAELSLLWPCAAPGALLGAAGEDAPADASAGGETPATPSDSAPESATTPAPTAPAGSPITSLTQLPDYARSLLRVEVPVTVRLASKKQSIEEIVDLGAGAIITFEKSCEEPIELTVGDVPVATGEAVKVGEKFGIRIDQIILPGESFKTVTRPAG